MNFDLDDQQAMLRDLMARFAGDRCGLEQRMADRRTTEGFSTANWATLAELGLLALPFAEDHGGLGGGAVEIATVAEEIGRGLCAEPWLGDLLLAGRLLERAGSDTQRGDWIGRIAAGAARLALAFAEPNGRFDPFHVGCIARNGALSGEKTFVQAGVGVDAYLVTARHAGGVADRDGIGVWIVPADAAGLHRRDYRLVDGSVACELRLDGVVADGRLPEDGGAALAATFDDARIAACAEMLGVMELIFRQTLEYLRTRRQFGRPIGSFQALQHRMAQLYVRLEQSRSHLLRAMLAPDDADRARTIAGAKAFVSENAVKLGEDCIQLHGGMGVTDELAIGHGHKRILLLASMFGDPETELCRYARLVA